MGSSSKVLILSPWQYAISTHVMVTLIFQNCHDNGNTHFQGNILARKILWPFLVLAGTADSAECRPVWCLKPRQSHCQTVLSAGTYWSGYLPGYLLSGIKWYMQKGIEHKKPIRKIFLLSFFFFFFITIQKEYIWHHLYLSYLIH